jgi:hypothetical protein
MIAKEWSDCGVPTGERLAAEQEAREREQARQTALAAERAHNAGLAAALEAAEAVHAAAATHAAPQASQPAPAPIQRAAAPSPRADEPATLNLGAICGRLGFTVSAQFLADVLRIAAAKQDKTARLYTESQFGLICRQLQSHVSAMAELYAGEPA